MRAAQRNAQLEASAKAKARARVEEERITQEAARNRPHASLVGLIGEVIGDTEIQHTQPASERFALLALVCQMREIKVTSRPYEMFCLRAAFSMDSTLICWLLKWQPLLNKPKIVSRRLLSQHKTQSSRSFSVTSVITQLIYKSLPKMMLMNSLFNKTLAYTGQRELSYATPSEGPGTTIGDELQSEESVRRLWDAKSQRVSKLANCIEYNPYCEKESNMVTKRAEWFIKNFEVTMRADH
ncbi:hypothetical protein MIR68_011892 [Amoeboaphelidium protococcarum]|nr:hypothetical protein MIR68_011892 [Amoeboaphelidium protococcarum]